MLPYIKQKGSYAGLLNSVFNHEDTEQKPIVQISYLLLIEIVRIFNANKINPLDMGYEIIKPTNLINKQTTVSLAIIKILDRCCNT